MTFNLELAKTVRELIRQHPNQHNQCEWSTNYYSNPIRDCGTSACIAGWVAAANGRTVNDVEEDETLQARGIYMVSSYAQEELGLSEAQHDSLFWELNDKDALTKLDLLIETNGEADYDDLEAAVEATWR